MTTQEKIIALTEKMVAIKSVPEHPEALDEILKLVLDELSEFTIERFEKDGVKSALVYNTPTRPPKFAILLNGHLDVIPGKDDQYRVKIDGDKMFGVGTMDMKSNVACMLYAFKDVASDLSVPVALQLVTDEEIGGFKGTKFQVEEGVRADFVMAGEPTNFDIVHKTKGVLWLKITASGKSAHGAYPWRGDNAILKINEFLNTLQATHVNPAQQEWRTTINVATIETPNTALNKIPDSCTIGLDIRQVPEDRDAVLEMVTSLLPKECKLEILAHEPAVDTSDDNPLLLQLKQIAEGVLSKEVVLRGAQGSSDARHFQPVGCPGVEFGPVGENIGADDEFVYISSLEKFYEITKRFLRSVDEATSEKP